MGITQNTWGFYSDTKEREAVDKRYKWDMKIMLALKFLRAPTLTLLYLSLKSILRRAHSKK